MATIRNQSFIPTSITGCQLWLDAADASTYTMSGTNLVTWTDKSTNAYSCVPVSGNSITKSTQNNLNVFSMSSTRATISNFAWSNDATIIFVTRSASSLFLYSQWAGGAYATYTFVGNNNLYYVGGSATYNDSLIAGGTSVITANTWGIFSIGYNSTSRTVANYSINGTARNVNLTSGSAPGSGTSTAQLYINGNGASASDISFVAEVIQYNRAVTTNERQALEGYLAWKWGLQSSLPSTHPFRTVPPNSTGSVIYLSAPITMPSNSLQANLSPIVFFNPRTIAGCTLWLDGNDPNGNGTSPTNGASITTWVDKSGAGNNATGGTSPTFNSTGVNNLGTVSFNGSTMYLTTQDLYTNRSFFIFIILRRQATISTFTGFFGGSGSSANTNLALAFLSNTSIRFGFYGNDLDYNSFPTYTGITTTEPAYILEYYYTPGTRQIWVNGTLGNSDTNSTNLSSFANPNIGRYTPTGSYFNGFIGEFITYNATFTTAQRQQVEGYLAWKWGLQASLPSNHPYRYTVPGLTINIPIPTNSLTPATFSPRNISGCKLWLDGFDPNGNGIVPANGDAIGSWVDKSGTGNTFTASGTVTYSLASRALTFNSTFMYNSSFTGLVTGNTSPLTIFIVFNSTNVSVTRGLFGYGTVGSSNQAIILYVDTDSKVYGTTYFNNFNVNTSFSTGTTYIISDVITYNGTAGNFTRNAWLTGTPFSTASASVSSLNITSGQVNIGNLGVSALYIGNISEVLYYSGTLNTTQRQSVEGYLAWKYGLQGNLPTSHPFKRFPPPPN